MFEKIQDEELLISCKQQVLIEKSATAKVLEYLTEIDRRKLWIKEGYASMYDFCIRYLGYSEGEANRRIQAARLSQRVEEVKPLLEQGEVSLTSLTLLAPVLTQENAKELLPKVMGKSSREVEALIEEYFPERAAKKELFEVEIDDEIKTLLEEARKLASEKDNGLLLKKVLKAYIREKRARNIASKHTRRVATSTAKEVKRKSGYRCEYVSAKGIRCSQTAHLEVDHVRPYAFGGSSKDIENLRCFCKVHNLYLARHYFPKSRTFESQKWNVPIKDRERPHFA
ncbi:MAG: HNH endonuclease [Deltaproteobacteria bacterium]